MTITKLRATATLPPSYNPIGLLEQLSTHMRTTSDYALAKSLELPPPTISKIRNHRAPVTSGVLLRMHDVTGIPVDTLRGWMGLEPFALATAGAPT